MIVTDIKNEDTLFQLNELTMESDREFKTEQDLDARREDSSHSRYGIKENEDNILRLNELAMESYLEFMKGGRNDRSLADKESVGGFKPKIEEENQKHSRYHIKEDEDIIHQLNELAMESYLESTKGRNDRSLADNSRYHIKEDEDIILRLNGLAMDSYLEFTNGRDDRSLADKESGGGFKPKIEEENQKYSRYDIKEDEDIIRRLNELPMESYPEFKKERDDRSLADNESDGGLKSKIEEENQKDLHEDASSHSRYDIKEDEYIVHPLNQLFIEPVRKSVNAAYKLKKEQNDLHGDLNGRRSLADEESDGGFKHKIEENAEDLNKDETISQYDIIKALIDEEIEEWDSSEDVDRGLQGRTKETLRITESQEEKMKTEKVDPFGSALGPLEKLEEIVLKFNEFIDYQFLMLKDAQKVKSEVQDEFVFLEKVRYLLLTSSQRVSSLINELERMKNEVNSSPRKTQIPGILIEVVELNAFIVEQSLQNGIGFLFNGNYTEKELTSCVNQLNRSRDNLGRVLLRIIELKVQKLMMGTFQESESTEILKGIDELEIKDEESEKLKQHRRAFNASGYGVVPQLPDGFER